jgi:hypothetical protein
VQRVAREPQLAPIAGPDQLAVGFARDQRADAGLPVDVQLAAHRLDDLGHARDRAGTASGIEPQVLGTDADAQLALAAFRHARHRKRRGKAHAVGREGAARREARGKQVHGRRTDEARDEQAVRLPVERVRVRHLLERPAIHHRDAVAERHGFDLIVRHVDHGGAHALVQALDLRAGLHAQLGIEIGQRLVEQEHLGLPHHGAAERDALPLAARQLARAARQRGPEAQHFGGLADAPAHFLGRQFPALERERHVLLHCHVRVERVVLEHHRDVAVAWRQVVDLPLADPDLALAHVLESRDHAQHRGLAAAGRADQHHELAIRDGEVEIRHRAMVAAVDLADVREANGRHAWSPRPVRCGPGARAHGARGNFGRDG